jgi:small-conductance mechanosensitive channel
MPVLGMYLLEGLDGLLEWFTGDTSVDGWQETALNWLIAALVISVVCTGLMAVVKFVMKQKASRPEQRIWPRGKAVLFILLGLLPVLLLAIIVWYLSRDFVNIMTISGLFKGILFAWVLYLLLMLAGHTWGEWRNDLF